MAKKISTTALALKACRRSGWLAELTEHRLPANKGIKNTWGRKVDLFSFGDILVVQPGLDGVMLLQVTTKPQARARVRKIISECEHAARTLLKSRNRIEVWGYWQEYKGAIWQYRRIQIVLEGSELRSYDIET